MPLNKEQKDVLRKIYELYENDERKLSENKNRFMEKWDSYDSLHLVSTWWNSLGVSFSITAAGRALAYANAKREE